METVAIQTDYPKPRLASPAEEVGIAIVGPGELGLECTLNVSFEGIVTTTANGRLSSERVSSYAFAGYCGGAASWTEPLATLHWHNRVLWVVKNGVEDGYDYGLFDPDSNEPVTLQGTWDLRR